MKELAIINPEGVTEGELQGYDLREACRAVVMDNSNMLALLHVTNEKYYKLPGGGIEGNEDKLSALRRECLEEIGCDVEVISELGVVTEYRKIFGIKQISYCYLAKVKGEKGNPFFTNYEKEKGFESVWMTYKNAMKCLTECQATSIEGGSYIVRRDTQILEQAGLIM